MLAGIASETVVVIASAGRVINTVARKMQAIKVTISVRLPAW
jgi:hypothetical protein